MTEYSAPPRDLPDPHLWLEEVDSPDVLSWVRSRSDATLADLGSGDRADMLRGRALSILDATDRIAWPVLRGRFAYSVWKDAAHPRGLWRRIPRAELDGGEVTALDSRWEVLLDVDALAAEEGENWVYKSTTVRRPDDDRSIIALSRGGADATELREYDLTTARLVPPSEGGFHLPECKGGVSWVDADTLALTAPLGDDDATESGYPRLVRWWRRGTDPADAPVVFAAEPSDVSVGVSRDARTGRVAVSRHPGFHETETRVWPAGPTVTEVGPAEAPYPLPVPLDCRTTWSGQWLLLLPRTDLVVAGTGYPGGSVLAVPWREVDADPSRLPEPAVLFTPTPTSTVEDVTWGRDRLLLTLLDDVESRLVAFRIPDSPSAGAPWARLPVDGLPEHVTVSVLSCDPLASGGPSADPDAATLTVSGPVTPPSLVLLDGDGSTRTLARTPERFDATGVEVVRRRALSDDGTEVPYTVLRRSDLPGPRPTILYGYGGFEVSLVPSYAALRGALWVEAGGTYVEEGIRGGGEYGPGWHRAAVREGRPRAYEDFAAVARDLVAHADTTVPQLGATGGSNGGLLIGVMLTRYPELFGALAISVPLLDMRRYHLLPAGASWVAEYGDPDSADWEDFLGAYSPYQHVRSADEIRYPPTLLMTSTRDDRVHPGHARKMCAALEAAGQEVAYYENTEGGHAGAADNAQEATKAMLTYGFFARRLGLTP